MSEPLGVEERARLREWAETPACPWPTDRWESVEVAMSALLDHIDRLTGRDVERLIEASSLGTPEAKAARESVPREVGIAIAIAAKYLGRAERAEADLADEKRQHAETLTRAALDIDKLLLRVAGFDESWDRGYCQGVQDAAYAVRERRALLDTATEGSSDE